MLPQELKESIQHMEWADSLVWKAALALPEAASDPLTLQRLHHVHMVQWVYLRIWRGEPLDPTKSAPLDDLRAIHAWAREYHALAGEHWESFDPAALQNEVKFPFPLEQYFGTVSRVTLTQTIQQIVSHTTYHRGQINARLRELGGEPPLVDFVVWVWRGLPAPEWPNATATSKTPPDHSSAPP